MGPGFDELQVAGLTLRGVAQGGVRTCLMVPELDLMFDVAPYVKGMLRFDTILASHGHQDHLGALPYLVSQRNLMRSAPPKVHVPVEIVRPLEQIFAAWSEIEGFDLPVHLHGHAPEDRVEVRKDLVATCVRSRHRVPSLAWIVERRSQRLRPEFRDLPGPELGRLRREGVPITHTHVEPLIAVTGDTQIELFVQEPRLRACRVLVHEVTSWDDRRSVEETRAWGHTHVDEMIAHCEAFEGEALVLVHRSLRHRKRDAEAIVQARFPAGMRERVHVFGT